MPEKNQNKKIEWNYEIPPNQTLKSKILEESNSKTLKEFQSESVKSSSRISG